jgi:hypothetical protein
MLSEKLLLQLSLKKILKEIKTKLEQIRAGQSMNLAYWASKILKQGKITSTDLEKLNKLQGFEEIDSL